MDDGKKSVCYRINEYNRDYVFFVKNDTIKRIYDKLQNKMLIRYIICDTLFFYDVLS